MRSWLGLAQFCSRFLQGFEVTTSCLWDLTKEQAEWIWTEKHDRAFNYVKGQLTSSPVVTYWDNHLETRATDASPVGLGAILEEKQADGAYRPV